MSNTPTPNNAPAELARIKPELRHVSYTLLLPPLLAAREQFDEQRLHDLIASIQLIGIAEPLVVEIEGDRYRVHAGHRRMIAAEALKLEEVPVLAYPAGVVPGEAIKSHENAFREDLNAAEEAHYFQRLLAEECGNDVDKLCFTVQQKREYVEGRLLLISGDKDVFRALAQGQISIGVARELNLVKSVGRRRLYLDCAARGGTTVRLARQWRIQGNLDDEAGYALPSSPPPPTDVNQPVSPAGMECILCHGKDDQWEMEVLMAHRSCLRSAERQAALRAGDSNA